jgi:hypothetical protein
VGEWAGWLLHVCCVCPYLAKFVEMAPRRHPCYLFPPNSQPAYRAVCVIYCVQYGVLLFLDGKPHPAWRRGITYTSILAMCYTENFVDGKVHPYPITTRRETRFSRYRSEVKMPILISDNFVKSLDLGLLLFCTGLGPVFAVVVCSTSMASSLEHPVDLDTPDVRTFSSDPFRDI